ncbi:MAG: hypothetical protein HYV75_05410 [Opitutae bacterium]|nr:hypothetical protein [Opitutae bacterium]
MSKAVRFRTFSLRENELPVRLEAAAETVCELAGGDAYRAVRAAATEAEHEYHQSITRTGHCPERYARHELCLTAVAAHRRQFQAEIATAQRRCVRAYWAEQRQHWLRSNPFAHFRRDHPIQRIAAFTPVWWELFLRCLHTEFSRRDFTQFHLLDALPQLRRQVRPKKVLAALVEEWREAHADGLGLPAQLHYHVLARRGRIRARETKVVRTKAGSQERAKTSLMVAPTWTEIDALNAHARDKLRKVGKISGEDQSFISLRAKDWTKAQQKDIRNYQPGNILVAHKATKHFANRG